MWTSDVKWPERTAKNTSRFTPENVEVILGALRKGLPPAHAAAICNLPRKTLEYWLKRGEQQIDEEGYPTGAYGEFAIAAVNARAEFVKEKLAQVDDLADGGQVIEEEIVTTRDGRQITKRKYAPPQWQGKMTMLERLFPADFSLRVKQEQEVNKTVEIRIVETDRWREVNAAAGKFIEGEVIDSDVKELDGTVLSIEPPVAAPGPADGTGAG